MLEKTLRAVELAAGSGIKTKINSLIMKGFNEDEITALAGFAFRHGIDARFIEMMPVGAADAGRGMSNETVLAVLKEKWPEYYEKGDPYYNPNFSLERWDYTLKP